MVHPVSVWMQGVQVKLWDPLRTRAIPEHLRGVFTTRRYTNSHLPYLTLPLVEFSGITDQQLYVTLLSERQTNRHTYKGCAETQLSWQTWWLQQWTEFFQIQWESLSKGTELDDFLAICLAKRILQLNTGSLSATNVNLFRSTADCPRTKFRGGRNHSVITRITPIVCTCNLVMVDNKKLRYCEEYSASVVLSWCTLWHFSGENLLMANQPLLSNWPQKLPNSAK